MAPTHAIYKTYLEKIADQFEVDWQPTIKLTTDQMIEPMAAPIGYSVQAAQGTGLGPDAQNMAMTGTRNTDEEINFQKANAIPPAAPNGFGSNQSSNNNGRGDGGDGGGAPLVSATAYAPNNTPIAYVPGEGNTNVASPLTQATNLNNGKPSANDAYEEVDIFVPTVPSAPPSASTPNSSNKNDDDDDDYNNDKPSNDGDTTATGSGGTSTYEDLAARFDQLNK